MMLLLPLPVAPTSANVCPGSASKLDVVQDRPLGVVAERHVLELHAARRCAAAAWRRATSVHVGLRVEQVEHALGAGHRHHQLVVEVPEVEDRVHEPVPVQERRDDRADACPADLPGDDEVAAVAEDDHLADEADELQQRLVDAVDARDADVVGGVVVLEAVEDVEVRLLAVERGHHAHAGDVLGEVGETRVHPSRATWCMPLARLR